MSWLSFLLSSGALESIVGLFLLYHTIWNITSIILTSTFITTILIIHHRDVATAERLAKAGETANRTKETQLKRATEAVTRLKAQLQVS